MSVSSVGSVSKRRRRLPLPLMSSPFAQVDTACRSLLSQLVFISLTIRSSLFTVWFWSATLFCSSAFSFPVTPCVELVTFEIFSNRNRPWGIGFRFWDVCSRFSRWLSLKFGRPKQKCCTLEEFSQSMGQKDGKVEWWVQSKLLYLSENLLLQPCRPANLQRWWL